MQCRKCLTTLASALIIAAAVLGSSGAARASTYKIIHEFEVPKTPMGNLVIDAAGNLYGTTAYGGASCYNASGCGVVWKLAPNGILTRIHEFTGPGGAVPYAGLVFDTVGNLYGTTIGGGAHNAGVVFKLAPNPDGTWTESVLYSFINQPSQFGLVFDSAGNLYGTTIAGGTDDEGAIFKLAPNPDGTWTESVLYSFTGGADGGFPDAGLIVDAAGNLYGTTESGGATNGYGVVFKLAPNPDGTWTESVLYHLYWRQGRSTP